MSTFDVSAPTYAVPSSTPWTCYLTRGHVLNRHTHEPRYSLISHYWALISILYEPSLLEENPNLGLLLNPAARVDNFLHNR